MPTSRRSCIRFLIIIFETQDRYQDRIIFVMRKRQDFTSVAKVFRTGQKIKVSDKHAIDVHVGNTKNSLQERPKHVEVD